MALTRRHGIELSDSRFHQDVDRLIVALADTPVEHTSEARPVRVADRATWLDRRLALAVAVVVFIGAAGYWLLSRQDTSSVAGTLPSAERANTPARDPRDTAGASSSRPGTAGSGPILESSNNAPVDEREANDDILHPNDLAFGTTVRAQIRPVADKDFFRIRTPTGTSGEVRVVLSNRSKLRPEIEIWDRNFARVTSKSSRRGDLYHSFAAEPDTNYFVECRFSDSATDRAYADPKDSGSYELTVLFLAQ